MCGSGRVEAGGSNTSSSSSSSPLRGWAVVGPTAGGLALYGTLSEKDSARAEAAPLPQVCLPLCPTAAAAEPAAYQEHGHRFYGACACFFRQQQCWRQRGRVKLCPRTIWYRPKFISFQPYQAPRSGRPADTPGKWGGWRYIFWLTWAWPSAIHTVDKLRL